MPIDVSSDDPLEPLHWGEYAVPEYYSKSDIVTAGKLLRGDIVVYNDEAVNAFRIAWAWRNAHAQPMRRVRSELTSVAKKVGSLGITAARVKRMKSIRKKLRNDLLSLYQIQDIAGCRAIVHSIAEIEKIAEFYRDGGSRHEFQRPSDYIQEPLKTGYRSYHFVLKFNGTDGEEAYNRQRIEVQLRTVLQHAWATAVEAAGLARNEDLKGGNGDTEWLRLFAIMGAEFAVEEGQPGVPEVSENKAERRAELIELDAKLGAVKNLKLWNNAIQFTESIQTSPSRFYLIQYDPATRQASVHPASYYARGAEQLQQEEQAHGGRDTVLVEMDRAEYLREAYPNYFLDVGIFTGRLEAVLSNHAPAPLNYPRPKPKYARKRPDVVLQEYDYRYFAWWRNRRKDI